MDALENLDILDCINIIHQKYTANTDDHQYEEIPTIPSTTTTKLNPIEPQRPPALLRRCDLRATKECESQVDTDTGFEPIYEEIPENITTAWAKLASKQNFEEPLVPAILPPRYDSVSQTQPVFDKIAENTSGGSKLDSQQSSKELRAPSSPLPSYNSVCRPPAPIRTCSLAKPEIQKRENKLQFETEQRSSTVGNIQKSISRVTGRLFSSMKLMRNDQTDSPNLNMTPKPDLTGGAVTHDTFVQYFQQERSSLIRLVLDQQLIRGFEDAQKTRQAVKIDLCNLASLECIELDQADADSYWFRLSLAIPKYDLGEPRANSRKTYIFGVLSSNERAVWMMNILRSVTGVFEEDGFSCFRKAGWCYTKAASSSSWNGAWVLIEERILHVYNCDDKTQEHIDLRKINTLRLAESDSSMRKLHVDPGSMIALAGPGSPAMNFIMASPVDTQSWKVVTEEAIFDGGETLDSQQLTEKNVPVLIERCVNFLNIYGSLSEGLYVEKGSKDRVDLLLQQFKQNAFGVFLDCDEFTEFDVAQTLRKFIRNIPNSFFGQNARTVVEIFKVTSNKAKIIKFKELLASMTVIERNSFKMLMGHLRFLCHLSQRNKVDMVRLTKTWSKALLPRDLHFPSQETILLDLIFLYEDVFVISAEELLKERQMVEGLVKYQEVIGNEQRSAHKTGIDVWITIQLEGISEENKVTITSTVTALDVLRDLASKTGHPWHQLTLYEVIDEGRLVRPIHYAAKISMIMKKWSSWSAEDSKGTTLQVRSAAALESVYRYVQLAPVLAPSSILCFADRRTKELKKHKLQLIANEIVVFRIINLERDQFEQVMRIDLATVYAFVGYEAIRGGANLRWAMTLVERDFKARSRESQYIGHVFGGIDRDDQTTWHASILHSVHREGVLPRVDLLA